MSTFLYNQTPERLVRPAEKLVSPTATTSILDKAAATQLAKIAEQMLDERPGEGVLVAQAPYFWSGKPAGSIWVEVEHTSTNHRTSLKESHVRTLTGRTMFEEYCGEGQWMPSDRTKVFAQSLRHIAIVKDGEITKYMERPNLKLVPDIPDEMLEDAGFEETTEYRLQQQELEREVEREDECTLSNVVQIGENKFRAIRPDGKRITVTIPAD